MTTALAGAVELLDRALGYTRGVLAAVHAADPGLPTPCRDWTLGDLLAHMEDALDAFTEAAGGRVGPPPGEPRRPLPERLRAKACALLGAWSGDVPPGVRVAGRTLDSGLLVAAAALEITIHGWDVGTTVGDAPPIPDELAVRLLEVAHLLVGPADRAVRFAAPREVLPDAAPGVRLLAFLGRG